MNDTDAQAPTVSPSRNGHPEGSAPARPKDQAVGEPQERRGASRSEAPRSGGVSPTSAASGPTLVPEPEAADRPLRRFFSAEYKLRILREVDACSKPGDRGALLRREGLYSSLITDWRRQRETGELEGLEPKKRGAKPKRTPAERENERLLRENARLQEQLRRAELIIEAQKKVTQIFEELSSKQAEDEPSGNDS